MTKRILICGLPGSGKTTLAYELQQIFHNCIVLDGDAVRYATGNNDFTYDGRLKQTRNMRDLAAMLQRQGFDIIAAYVAPMHELREMFDADITIWMDTIVASTYQDTNALWQDPTHALLVFTEWMPPGKMAETTARAIELFRSRL
jgi:adenylylsulfate kinase